MPNLEVSHISSFDIATPLIIVALFLTIAIIRPLIVLVHELGHAIPALLFTDKSVSIFIGSYWNPDKCFCIKIRRINIWIKQNPLSWYKGSCMSTQQVVSTYKNVIYIVSGPILPFVLGVIFCYLTFSFDLHGSLKYFSIIFLSWAVIDLFINLYPTSYPTKLENRKILYSDGFQLIRILGFNRFK